MFSSFVYHWHPLPYLAINSTTQVQLSTPVPVRSNHHRHARVRPTGPTRKRTFCSSCTLMTLICPVVLPKSEEWRIITSSQMPWTNAATDICTKLSEQLPRSIFASATCVRYTRNWKRGQWRSSRGGDISTCLIGSIISDKLAQPALFYSYSYPTMIMMMSIERTHGI